MVEVSPCPVTEVPRAEEERKVLENKVTGQNVFPFPNKLKSEPNLSSSDNSVNPHKKIFFLFCVSVHYVCFILVLNTSSRKLLLVLHRPPGKGDLP